MRSMAGLCGAAEVCLCRLVALRRTAEASGTDGMLAISDDMAERASKKPNSKPKGKGQKRAPRRKPVVEPGPVGRATRFVVLGGLRLIWAVCWKMGLVGAAILASATLWFYTQLPPASALFDGRGTGSVTLLDRDGNVFAWRGEQYGGELRATQVSPHLVHAVVATEDKRFWGHIGIDPRGIARAAMANIRAGRLVQGGSTLTQQVAKNVFLTAERSIERKLKEVPMALALELKYTKEEILSIYLNRVYLGAGTFGFEAASQRYFSKSSRLLSPSEAAMLAGLLRAPSRYAPTSNLDRAQGRASVIIRLMQQEGFLNEAQVYDALARPAALSEAAAARAGGFFADWVMETAPSFLAGDTTEDVTIGTTFDPSVQAAVEAAVETVFADKVKKDSVAQAAVVVMTPFGAVRAIVGGRDYGVGQFNRATQALRQTGSAFKPIVYAAGLQAGLSPYDVMEDAPLTIDAWSPANYDRTFRGPITLTEALARSINTVAVRVSEEAGRAEVRELASDMGITTPLALGPAVALGTSEATLVDMTGVYATIANSGRRAVPVGIREIRLRGDNTALLQDGVRTGPIVLPPAMAQQLTWMLTRVVEEGTGRRAQFADWQIAGKTGTTQGARDAWFIGFTGAYVIGVWMGNDDNTPLTGVTGGGLPAEIWREVAVRVHKGLDPQPLALRRPEPAIASAPRRRRGETVVERVLRDVLVGLGGASDRSPGGGQQFDTFGEPDR